MSDVDLAAAAHGLTESYTDVSAREIVLLLDSAVGTVTRMLGRLDWEMAVDLTRLRLDLGTRRAA